MFMGITFCEIDDKGAISKELKAVVNTNAIDMIVENPQFPGTCMIRFNDDTPVGLIKGTYEENAKVLFGFNRKLS